MLANGDGEANALVATGGNDSVGVEAAVGPHGEWTGGFGVTHSAGGFTQDVCGASGRVGPALPQPRHQHVAGSGRDGEERVMAPPASVVVALCTFFAQSVGLAGGGVQVDGQRTIAGSGPSPSEG